MTSGFAEETLLHDAAGNLTYDGIYAYSYDAWNRLVTVRKAYRQPDGGEAGDLKLGMIHSVRRYDGLHRRITKEVDYARDSNGDIVLDGQGVPIALSYRTMTYHAYHDGQQLVEERDRAGNVLRQYVWSHEYIDSLAQVAVNVDLLNNPEMELDPSEGEGPRLLYALHDIQFNVLGLVDEDGDLVERYEYGAYGQRSVYIPTGDADRFPDEAGYYACTYKAGTSQRASTGGGGTTYGHALNPIGFQGLYHDEETASSGSAWHGGIIHNRFRAWHTTLGRFVQRDPLGYPDGLNAYAGYHVMWGGVDPWGMQVQWHHLFPQAAFKDLSNTSWIHKQEHGWIMNQSDHTRGGVHREWNREWEKWVKGRQDAGLPITEEAAIGHRKKLVSENPKFQQWLAKGRQTDHTYHQWRNLTPTQRAKYDPANLTAHARRHVQRMTAISLGGMAAWSFFSTTVGVAEAASTKECLDWFRLAYGSMINALAGEPVNCSRITNSNAHTLCAEHFELGGVHLAPGSSSGAIVTRRVFEEFAIRLREACACPSNRGRILRMVEDAWNEADE